jgi:hypothetical protein
MEIAAEVPESGWFPWLLAPPRETLLRRTQRSFSPVALGLVLTGSLLSVSLAERLLVPSRLTGFAATYFSFLVAFVATAFLFHQLSRLVLTHETSFGQWIQAGIVAIVPLNLLLPAALIAQSMGTSGLVLYEFFKMIVAWAFVRRCLWAIEAVTHWPPWACLALYVGPFLVAMVVGLFLMALVGVALLATFLASPT